MSYDSDFEKVYMVVFKSGRTIHVGQFTVEDVIEYCDDYYVCACMCACVFVCVCMYVCLCLCLSVCVCVS